MAVGLADCLVVLMVVTLADLLADKMDDQLVARPAVWKVVELVVW